MSGLDRIALQVLGAALRGVAEEMQAAMVHSAHSPNITERRDCSAAIFDARARMLAQAESIPVHLGAMPDAVAAVLDAGAGPGEVWMLNDPFRGGTHLPDITLVSPVAVPGADLLAVAVTRAHHADVGGIAPGSMPAASRELLQEGLVIPPVRLATAGVLDPGILAIICANSRTPRERRGDLRAQLAAHRLAERRLREIAAERGADAIVAAADAIQAHAERRVRAAIASMPDGAYRAADALEGDGISQEPMAVAATVTIAGDTIGVDFAGTSSRGPGNLNCPLAVTRSAVYFAIRVATDPDVPASAGAFGPVTVTAPPGCLVNALPGAAVAGGNVETSSRIVDVVLAALGQAIPLPAAGQGTMNNLTIGGTGPSGPFTYYETIGGGQGAAPTGPGPSAVHVAMSNTLNTPIEVLETTCPLRVEAYRIRRGTGGSGLHRGGDGVERRIRLLCPAAVSIISERRAAGPPGAAGGAPGAPGANLVDGAEVGAKWRGDLPAGSEVAVLTPGGGGYGVPVVD